MTKRSTIALVAERAGVSVASVSRVLNGLPASQSVTDRVTAAVDELGYVPLASARSLKFGRTEQISLAVADAGNPVYVSMMNEISAVVQEAGFRLVLSSTGADPEAQVQVLRDLERGFVDGLILSPLRITDDLLAALQTSRKPVVVIGSLPAGVPVDSVRADSARGISIAVAHLVGTGRRRIAFLNGPVDTVPGAARLSGYLAAVAEHGFTAHDDLRAEASDFTYQAGITAARDLFDRSNPDAVVASNDLLAAAVLSVARERAIDVPRDLAVVGMDDTDLAQIVSPALTSVDLRSRSRARKAAKLLLRRIEQPDRDFGREVVEPRLRVRASTVSQGEELR